jgi:hypothetical protein
LREKKALRLLNDSALTNQALLIDDGSLIESVETRDSCCQGLIERGLNLPPHYGYPQPMGLRKNALAHFR